MLRFRRHSPALLSCCIQATCSERRVKEQRICAALTSGYAVPKGDALGPNGAAAGDPWTQGPWALVQHRDVLHKCFRECAAGVYDLTYYASSPSQLSVTQPVERKYCSNESLSAAAEIQEVECTSSVFKCSKQMGTASNACSGKFQLTEAYDGNQTTQLTWFMALSFFISQPARGKTESVIQASFVLPSGTEYVGWYTIDESKCTGVGFWGPSFLVSAGEVEDPPDPPIIPEMQKLPRSCSGCCVLGLVNTL